MKTVIPNFNQPGLLAQALTHRSAINEGLGMQHNERLEFLGDAVLELVVSEFLYQEYPSKSEGGLTSARTALVRTETLSELALDMDLPSKIKVSKGEARSGGLKNPSLLADTIEAVIGAIYLDQGITAVRNFLTSTLLDHADDKIQAADKLDTKSKLQELVQANNKPSPVYRIIHQEGPDHHRIYTAQVFVAGQPLGRGIGKSKQEAEQSAASATLKML